MDALQYNYTDRIHDNRWIISNNDSTYDYVQMLSRVYQVTVVPLSFWVIAIELLFANQVTVLVYRKSSMIPPENDWKLLWRLSCVSGSYLMLPKTFWFDVNIIIEYGQALNGSSIHVFVLFASNETNILVFLFFSSNLEDYFEKLLMQNQTRNNQFSYST